MNELWFFLPGIIYLGIVTSYTDIIYGKIKNRDVVIGICYALLVNLLLSIYFLFFGSLKYLYFAELGTNALFALAVAFGLWYYKIWSAGDGKLFFAFTLLLPLGVYQYGRYNWMPSLALLINIFSVGLVLMFFLIVKNARLKNYKKAFFSFFEKFFEPKQLLKSVFSLFAFFWLAQIILSWAGLGGNLLLKYTLTIVFLYTMQTLLSRVFPGKLPFIIVFGAVTVLRLAIDKSVYSFQFLWNFILLLFIWKLFRGLLRQGLPLLGKELFSKEIPISKLKPGMIMAGNLIRVNKLNKEKMEELTRKNVRVIKKDKIFYILGGEVRGKPYLNTQSVGLTKEDITKIKKIGFKKVKISATIPFAPLVFFGVIATLLAKGNILILVRVLFQQG